MKIQGFVLSLATFVGYPISVSGNLSNLICANDHSFRFSHGNMQRDCQWVRGAQEGLREDLCRDLSIRDKCVYSCGVCCEDNPFYSVPGAANIQYSSCRWLGRKEERKSKYCDRKSNGLYVRDHCPVSCNTCASFVPLEESDASSTTSSTSSPTSIPTNDPSAEPSKYPLAEPSSKPTYSPVAKPTPLSSMEQTKSPTPLPSTGSTEIPPSPTEMDIVAPSYSPSGKPIAAPVDNPTAASSPNPTRKATLKLSLSPTLNESDPPSFIPLESSDVESSHPTFIPTNAPSATSSSNQESTGAPANGDRSFSAPTIGQVSAASQNGSTGANIKNKAADWSMILLALGILVVAAYVGILIRRKVKKPECVKLQKSRDDSNSSGIFSWFGTWSKSGSSRSRSSSSHSSS